MTVPLGLLAPLALLLQLATAADQAACPTGGTEVVHTLSFPELHLDDPAAYDGYRTRFFRDAAGNTVQVYIKEREGRLVNLWADAANESLGFTARDTAGAPAALAWLGDSACVAVVGSRRSVAYRLRSDTSPLELGHFILGSMRVERDAQYTGRHLEPFGPPFVVPELEALVDRIETLPEPERRRHLAALDAGTVDELAGRLEPGIRLHADGGRSVARIEQPSLDDRNRLVLELSAADPGTELDVVGSALRVTAPPGQALVLDVRVVTDAAPLTPLTRADIFNARFLAFHDSIRAIHDRALEARPDTPAPHPAVLRYRRLERQVRGLELVSSREKLLAGLPNYATYFGRDLLVAGLLMQPIWAGSMNEHVLGSVLRKLSPDGQVSHEEALGGQAIREHAAAYVALVDSARERSEAGEELDARQAIERARELLRDMQRVRENYAMVDDEYQLPVLAARYLAAEDVAPDRKREFLLASAGPGTPDSRIARLLDNLAFVAERTAAYVLEPVPANLVAFPEREPGRYHAASWRDSGAGYGNGRYAMDVNVIWVPQTLESIGAILDALRSLDLDPTALPATAPSPGSALAEYARDRAALERAIRVWRDAAQHFAVRLPAAEARARIAAKLASLPTEEARYWDRVLDRTGVPDPGIAFLALSLDSAGEPIGILGTDIATRWFLDDITGELLADPDRLPGVLEELRTPFLLYPVGLLVDGLGPLVANDAYATPDVWAGFERDDYHSPRVVWGREVNLLLMGLMRQIDAAHDDAGRLRDPRLGPYVETLRDGLRRTLDAVERSGLQHNELWSYRIQDGRLLPVRWGASTDVQLWNLTNLAVEMLLAERGAR